LLETLFASFDSHVLRILVELNISDHLTETRSVDELAELTDTDDARLERVLRYAASRGFVEYSRSGRISGNGMTEALASDDLAHWAGWVRFATSDWFDASWRNLGPSLSPDSPPAFALAHGTDFFEYTTSVNPAAGEAFDEAMAAGAKLQAIALARSLDWVNIDSVCDVGGGNGAALDILLRYEPHLNVTLFDLPGVVERSSNIDSQFRSAWQTIGGSFFEEVPPGHDRYLLLAIVHDWDDTDATTILSNVSAAMGTGGEAVVVETAASDRPRDDFAAAADLLMFVLASGRERTHGQYHALFSAAGLRVHDQRLLPSGATAFTLKRESNR
jgi:hypothetical protein